MKKDKDIAELLSLPEAKLEACPTGPGVYLMKDAVGHVIYVGKAKSLRARVRSYFQAQAEHSAKTLHMVGQVRDIEFLRATTEAEALLLENNLIKKWKPRYNIRLRDDKTYPYLRVDFSHEFPRPYIARKQVAGDRSEYFGPYPNAGALRETIRAAAKVFLLRDCRDHEFANRSRPCLSHQIGQCTAPCVGLVTKEDYAFQVRDFIAFVKGKTDELEQKWTAEMEQASEAMNFEKAARLRDSLAAIRETTGQEQRVVDVSDAIDRDVWALWPEELEEGAAAAGERAPDYGETDEVAAAFTESVLDVLILQFRGGKLIGRVHRTAETAERLGTEDLFATLVLQHYEKHLPPAQILVPPGALPKDPAYAEAVARVAEKLLRKKGAEAYQGAEAEMAQEDLEAGGVPAPAIQYSDEKAEWGRLMELAAENVKGLHEDSRALREKFEDGLVGLARMLDLEKKPSRMECIDISNFQGEANVASCVVFKDGRPDKNEYRHYKIQGVQGQDDFASMREVMSRRYGKPDSPRPDLLVVDGGKGQLAAVMEILKGLGCDFPVVALAKARTESDFKSEDVESSEERVFVPGQKNYIRFRNAAALGIMTHIRDEAHRFAITFHRQKRDRARFEG